MVDPLDSGSTTVLDDAPPPEAGSEGLPSQEAPAATLDPTLARLEALEAELEQRRQREADWDARLRETHAWGNEANMRARVLEQQLAGLRQPPPQEEDREPPPSAPSLSEKEREKLLDDPELLWRKMEEVANYATQAADYAAKYTYREVVKRVGPQLQGSQQFAALSEPILDMLSSVAIMRAKDHAKQTLNVENEEFDRYFNQAWQNMWTASRGDQTAFRAMTLNPEAITMALQMARSRNGVPLQRLTPPPTIGQGDQRRATTAPARSETVTAMESTFGTTFTDAELLKARENIKDLAAHGNLRIPGGR